MIQKILSEMKHAVYGKNIEIKKIMYDAMEATLCPSAIDDSTRLARFLWLVTHSASEDRCQTEVVQFTESLIAADYYFSAGKGRLAIPFLNKALDNYACLTDADLFTIVDIDFFVGHFRACNLKGKFRREWMVVKNLYILDGAARKVGLDLNLDELPADYIPFSWAVKDILLFILIGIIGTLLVLNPLDAYRCARLDGNPIPLWDTLELPEILSVVMGIILIVAEFGLIIWQFTPNYNRLMAQLYYWRFSC